MIFVVTHQEYGRHDVAGLLNGPDDADLESLLAEFEGRVGYSPRRLADCWNYKFEPGRLEARRGAWEAITAEGLVRPVEGQSEASLTPDLLLQAFCNWLVKERGFCHARHREVGYVERN